ncbi:MAG TPA: YciI family protein [Asticcacaulis sp.]|nr:YciI family protein [Asticcacaulis sp.]
MKFSLIIYETPEAFATRHDPVNAAAYWAAWPAYTKALMDAGVMAGGAGLQEPATATSIRFGPSGQTIEDGPFAETKEMLGGIYIIDVPSLDEAMKWAARMPLQYGGTVEVRPNLVMNAEVDA